MPKNAVELELNELRSSLAHSATERAKAEAKLQRKIAELEKQLNAKAPVEDDPREQILQLLATASKGKPGYLSHPQIEELCNITKSASHHYVNELEKEGRVWIRKTHDAKTGRPCFLVYHPLAVKA